MQRGAHSTNLLAHALDQLGLVATTHEQSTIDGAPVTDISRLDATVVVLGVDHEDSRRGDRDVVDVAVADPAAMQEDRPISNLALKISCQPSFTICSLAERSDVLGLLTEELGNRGQPTPRVLDASVTLSLDDDFDRMVFVGLCATMSIVVDDFTTAGAIWDRHVDTAVRDLVPAAECVGRFHRGRFLAAVDEPGARAEFERAAALAHEFDWPLIEHVALSELAGALAAEGELAAARPRLADAIRTWIKAGDLAQLWVTLHHVADFLTKDGDLQRARDVWSQLRDRRGFSSQTQRSALEDQFGEPPSTTLTDDEMLVWSRDLAEYLAIS